MKKDVFEAYPCRARESATKGSTVSFIESLELCGEELTSGLGPEYDTACPLYLRRYNTLI